MKLDTPAGGGQKRAAWTDLSVAGPARVWFAALGIVLLVLCAMVMWTGRLLFEVGDFNDDAAYLMQANAWSHGGDLFRTAESPTGEVTAYALGHAILLAPVAFRAGLDAEPYRVVSLVLMVACGVCVGALAWRPEAPFDSLLMGALTLLTPAAVGIGTAVMSDISFAFLTALLLLVEVHWTERNPRLALLTGLLAGFTLLVKFTGALALVLLLARRLWRREYGECVFYVLGASVAPLFYFSLLHAERAGTQWYVALAMQQAEERSWGVHLASWIANAAAICESEFVGVGDAPMLLCVIIGLAMWGAIRAPRLAAWIWFVPLYILGLSMWDYVLPRYLLLWYPLLVLLATRALPVRWSAPFLGVLLCLALHADSRTLAIVTARPAAPSPSYEWLSRHTQRKEVIAGVWSHRIGLLCGRPSVPLRSAVLYSEMLESLCENDVRYVLLDKADESDHDVRGRSLFRPPPRLTQWLDSSSLVRKLFETNVDVVYRVMVPPVLFRTAWMHFMAAARADDEGHSEVAVREARLALALVPDFPEAASLVAQNENNLQLFQRISSRYPMYLANEVNLAEALRRAGRTSEAREVLVRARQAAVDSDDTAMLQVIEQRLR